MQSERDGGGSVITHWKPEQIKNILVPILPKPTQQKIAEFGQKISRIKKTSETAFRRSKAKG